MVKQMTFRVLIGAFIISLFTVASPPPLKAETLMQCMSNCVKHEGNTSSSKSTCKSRCANVAIPSAQGGGQPDCMGTYKACNRSCASSDKSCKRQCKSRLMSCK